MPILLVGAGLSFGVAPNAGDVLRAQRGKAEQRLGIPPAGDEHCGHLYHSADYILDTAADNDRVPLKLRLARAPGITTDPRWTARVGVPLRGNTSRRRVIARLAREGGWASIWSLNWDRVLECALESVGFERNDARFKQPWSCLYTTNVTDKDVIAASRDGVLGVYKPLLRTWESWLSMLDRVDVMTMTPAGADIEPGRVARAKAQLAGAMCLVRLADPGEIGSVGTLD